MIICVNRCTSSVFVVDNPSHSYEAETTCLSITGMPFRLKKVKCCLVCFWQTSYWCNRM